MDTTVAGGYPPKAAEDDIAKTSVLGRVRVARYDSCLVQPWRNGRGTTRVLRQPGEGVDEWWVSVADLQTPVPFSGFPGVDRCFMPVERSVLLTIDGTRQAVAAGQPVFFSGEAVVTLALPEGPTRALNVFVARAAGRLDVGVRFRRGAVQPGSTFVVLEGAARLADGQQVGILDLAEGPAEVEGKILLIGPRILPPTMLGEDSPGGR